MQQPISTSEAKRKLGVANTRNPEVMARRARCAQMRSRGFSYRDISQAMHISERQVQRDILNACYSYAQQEYEATNLLRTQVGMHYDQLLAVWSRRHDKERDRDSLEAVLKIHEARRKLFGLDAPVRVEVEDVTETHRDEPVVQIVFSDNAADYEPLPDDAPIELDPVEETHGGP